MKRRSFAVFVMTLWINWVFTYCSHAQSVGIGTENPDKSAALDVSSKTQGLLVPRLTNTERDAIVNPADGLIIFCKTDSSFYFYDGAWRRLTPADEVWSIKGNNGINAASHFIGTTDDKPVKFKVNSLLRMQLDSAGRLQLYGQGNNFFIGENAGISNTSGTENYFSGHKAGYSNVSASYNQFIGYEAGYSNTTAINNQFLGYKAGYNNETGTYNQFIGYEAGYSNTSAGNNQFIGFAAGYSNTGGQNNSFIGLSAGSANTTGNYNCFIGQLAGASNTTGNENQFTGSHAGLANTTGNGNYFSGFSAGYENTAGNNNHFAGQSAGFSNTTGNNNQFIGYKAGYSNIESSNNQFIGYEAGYSTTTGIYNQFIGYGAGHENTTGHTNSFIGYEAGYYNTTGNHNYFVGYQAGVFNTTGSENHFIGQLAGHNNTTGVRNYFSGFLAGRENATGAQNHFSGYAAGFFNTTGSNNHFSGYAAGNLNIGGNNNTLVGCFADVSVGSLTRAGAIGYNAKVSQSNSFIIGGTGTDAVDVGIGVTAPVSKLHVNGTITATAPLNIISDAKYKTNIEPLRHSLDIIRQLKGVNYDWKRNDFPAMNFPANEQIGFIAQEVEKILPGVVTTDRQGNKSISYTSIIPLLVEALKEQQQQIEELKRLVNKSISSK